MHLEIDEHDISSLERGGIGYYLHNFYNGCESIFRSIARYFENDIDGDSWHSDLLKRMKLEINGYRPAVISEDLYIRLQDVLKSVCH